MLGGGFFIIAVIAALIGWAILQGKADAHRIAVVATANLSQTLANNLNSTVRQVDLSIQAIQDVVSEQQKSGQWDEEAILAAIARQDGRHPDLLGFRIFGADGKLRYGIKNIVNRNSDLTDRDEFKYLRDTRDSGLIISPPLFGHATGEWLIGLSRRITNPDGSFGGVIEGPLPIRALLKDYAAIDIGTRGTITLFHTNFLTAARFPETTGPKNPVGTVAMSPGLRAIIASGVQTAQYEYSSPVDPVPRTGNVRKIKGQPYYIVVGLAESDYLVEWRRDSTRLAVFGAIMVLAVLAGMLILHRRMSVWQQGTAALAESEVKLRALYELSPLGIVRNSLDGRFVEFNDAFSAITNYAAEELKSLDWGALTPQTYEGDKARQRESLQSAGHYGPYEVELVRKNGSSLSVQLRGMLVTAPDGSQYVWSLVEDIDARKDAEKRLATAMESLRQSNAELEQFASVASHDLRQPLRMVSSYLSLIDKGIGAQFDAETREFFAFAVDGAKRMDRLILDLLEFSRTGKSAEMVPVDLAEAVADAQLNLTVAINEAEANIVIDARLPTVTGDPIELSRLFQNLIGNAIKYRAPERSPRVEISCRRQDRDWLITVADNGIGIDPKNYDRAFGIFQRLVSRDAYEGTGIGLAVCKKIVEHHGGKIWIESEVGVGCKFLVRLPVAAAG